MALIDLVLPPGCAGCGRFGNVLCAACRTNLQPPERDEDRFFATASGTIVGDALTLAMAAFAYEGVTRRVLQRLKYGSARRLADPLGGAAEPALATLLALTGRLPLVPIPLHPSRQRQRGYNQAALLAGSLGTRVGCPVQHLLIRSRPTARQHRLDRAGRLLNLRAAFEIANEQPLPEALILIDDILTTGATLEACASVLIGAGCRRVYGFAIAREV